MEAKETSILRCCFGLPSVAPANFIDNQEEMNLVDDLKQVKALKDALPLVRTFIANYQEWALYAKQHKLKSHNEDSLLYFLYIQLPLLFAFLKVYFAN